MREIVIIMIMIIRMICFSDCCFDSEKIGLLQLKQMYSSSRKSYISDWGSDGDCCSWSRVECNSTTSHVTRLDVSNIRDYVWDSSEGWYLNASLFLPFPHLYQLDLSRNGIAGCIENEGFERLSTLVNLEILDLSNNNLNDSTSILQSLGVLPSLKSLYLSYNRLNGTINISDLNGLPNTNKLSLTDNHFQGQIFHQGLCLLEHLQELDLSENDLTGNLPWCLANFTSLQK